MSQPIAFSDSVKSDLLKLATSGGFVRAKEILARGGVARMTLFGHLQSLAPDGFAVAFVPFRLRIGTKLEACA